MAKETNKKYWSEYYDIPEEDVLSGDWGICYGTINVKTGESAEKISRQVKEKGSTANGGYMHGMPLGNITEYEDYFSITQ